MTKQQAYAQAIKELPNAPAEYVIDRAMEIYAAAFAEWVGVNYMLHLNIWYKKAFPETEDKIPTYTTAELLIEFEKN